MGGGLSKVGQNVKATINDLNAARKKRPPLGSYERHRLVRMSATAATLSRTHARHRGDIVPGADMDNPAQSTSA